MSRDDMTVAVYDAQAAKYAELVDVGATDVRLAAFIAALPDGGTALDLGCGPGNSAAAMRDAGLVVSAVDASQEMAEIALKMYGFTVTVATFDDISGHDLYDGIWANFSLLHAPKADLPRHLDTLHRALKTGGRFMIALKTGTGERRDNLGRKYSYFEEDELLALLKTAGFTVAETEFGEDTGLDGQVASWIAVTANG